LSDQIFLRAMEFAGRHGVSDEERADEQLIEMDIDVDVDLRAAGRSDDLTDTVSYAAIFELCRARVEEHSYHLLEALGEQVCSDVMASDPRIDRVVVTVRKPGVPIDGVLDHAGIRLERKRS